MKRSPHLELLLVCSVTYQAPLHDHGDIEQLTSNRENNLPQCHTPRNYHTPATCKKLLSANNRTQLSKQVIGKIHKQLGQATTTQMEAFICKAWQWNPSYIEIIKKSSYRLSLWLSSPATATFCLCTKLDPLSKPNVPIRQYRLSQQLSLFTRNWCPHQMAKTGCSSHTSSSRSD